ncbi:carbon-nitrogen hydrolase family protein [Amycolatopsis anabasis]|uniref:carbon-nitrogen hydrolase family protein n=1 Tax=Amycolatopsis anabasis TaxID=1840409 RepID=UPI00131B97B2|nr:carbon-nitrogen hydrolase family protein [Amycolatopsis anabasis]
MPRPLPVALVQQAALPAGQALDLFPAEVANLLAQQGETRLIVYPELHLCGVSGTPAEQWERLRDAAEPIPGPRTRRLAELAGDLKVWLVPGTVCERGAGGEVFNTALAFSPEGELVASYRKIFPWRPYERYTPGDRFVVFELPEAGRVGFAICYDSWFPELTRHVAWLGAEVVINPVHTTSPDREQELVLARANAIINQVFVVSVNTAGPVGTGQSLIVDPEGRVRAETAGDEPAVLTDVLDLAEVSRVRAEGTAGVNRMWDQFTDADSPVELPLYQGRIDPARWHPQGGGDR